MNLPFPNPGTSRWQLRDVLGDATHERDGSELQAQGLYLDEPAWKACAFLLTRLT